MAKPDSGVASSKDDGFAARKGTASKPDAEADNSGVQGVGDDAKEANSKKVKGSEGAAKSQKTDGTQSEPTDSEACDNTQEEAQPSNAEINEEALRQAAEWQDKYMRLHAEWDTYRRRQKEQAETQKALAAEKLVTSLIPVIDDLERSIDYAQKNGEAGLLSGVEAVLSKFIDVLKKSGVDVIDPKGEAFDALEAQAVGTVDDATQPDETVAEVYQKGYKLSNKVIRPASVTITQGGPRREKPNEDEEE